MGLYGTDAATLLERRPIERRDGGHRAWRWEDGTHCAGPDDRSGRHYTYPAGYDPRCGWCWLGASHTEDAHAAKLEESDR